MSISRRKTRTCKVGDLARGVVLIGSEHPVAIQTMCSTKTENAEETLAEILTIKDSGCDIIRLAIPNLEAAKNIPVIRAGMKKAEIFMPIVADIHFDSNMALAALDYGADKIRINPGTFHSKEKLERVIELAKKNGAAMRIGINAGSLEKDLWRKYGASTPEALAESALRWTKFVENLGFTNFAVSIKSERTLSNIEANRIFAEQTDLPLHLGITHAGPLLPGAVKSGVGIGTLLAMGVGDTIRVSLTDSIEKEVQVAKEILKSLGLYSKEPDIISCPTCGRIEIDLKKLVDEVTMALSKIKKPIRVAIMGCAVNGPGEAKESDFAIAGGKECGAIFYKGEVYKSAIPEAQLLAELLKLIEEKA